MADVDLCPQAFAEGRFPAGCTAKDFIRVDQNASEVVTYVVQSLLHMPSMCPVAHLEEAFVLDCLPTRSPISGYAVNFTVHFCKAVKSAGTSATSGSFLTCIFPSK